MTYDAVVYIYSVMDNLKQHLDAIENLFNDFCKSSDAAMNKISENDIKFQCLCNLWETKSLSFRQATEIVGGKERLSRLIDSGLVRAKKNSGGENAAWRINAADCIRNLKPALVKKFATASM